MCPETWDADAINSIESRAALIRSPVRRLRYLRRRTESGLPVAEVIPVNADDPSVRRPWLRPLLLVSVVLVLPAGFRTETLVPEAVPSAAWPSNLPDRVPAVWLVDKTEEFETYSNGLRIENMPAASTHRRSYVALPAKGGDGEAVVRTEPAGSSSIPRKRN